LNPLQVAELKGNKRKFKEEKGSLRKISQEKGKRKKNIRKKLCNSVNTKNNSFKEIPKME
jgi:hypothetical protein